MLQRVRIPHRGQSPSSVTQLPILTALHARSPTLFVAIIHHVFINVNTFWKNLPYSGLLALFYTEDGRLLSSPKIIGSAAQTGMKSAIANDSERVIEFFSSLSKNLYTKLGDLMKKTEYSSSFTLYDDVAMKDEYNDYTTKIKNQEEKILRLWINRKRNILYGQKNLVLPEHMWVGFHFHVYPNACKTSDFKDFPLTHIITTVFLFLIEVWLIYNVVLVSGV